MPNLVGLCAQSVIHIVSNPQTTVILGQNLKKCQPLPVLNSNHWFRHFSLICFLNNYVLYFFLKDWMCFLYYQDYRNLKIDTERESYSNIILSEFITIRREFRVINIFYRVFSRTIQWMFSSIRCNDGLGNQNKHSVKLYQRSRWYSRMDSLKQFARAHPLICQSV